MVLIAWLVIANFTMLRGIDRDHLHYDYSVMIEAALIGIIVVSPFIALFSFKYAWLVFDAYLRKMTSKFFGVRLDAKAP